MGARPKPPAAIAWPPWAILIGLTGLAFALRSAGLVTHGLWRDEVDAIRFAVFPLPELLRTFLTPGQNGPLYFFLLRPWLALAGETEFALRFFSLFFGVLAVPLAYRLGRLLLPGCSARQAQDAGQSRSRPGAALAVALLVATSPYLIWYSQEGKMYSLVVTLGLVSTICFLRLLGAQGSPWRWWLAYVIVTTASFYTHLIAALLVPAHAVILLVGPWSRRRRLGPWLLSLAALVLPYLPLLAWQVPALLHKVETGYRFYPLDEMLVTLWADYCLGVNAGTGWWALALFSAVGLAALLYAPFDTRPGRARLGVVLAWLLVPVLAFFLITLRRPMFTTRYLIFVVPAWLLLLAAGLRAVGRWSRPLAGLLLIGLVAANGFNLWTQAHAPFKTDFRGATAHVVKQLQPGDLVLFQIPYGRYSFDYYLEQRAGPQSYRWADGLYTNAGLPPEEAERLMAELVTGSQVVWLVESEAPMWDARSLVHGWLDAHGELTDRAEFTGVTVHRYALAPP